MEQKVRVGDTEVTRIGLGTNRLRKNPQNIAFIRAAVVAGVQLIDTAHLYTGGESEETIGAALSPMPEHVVVATKGGFGGPGRGRPEVLRAEIEDSLRRLGVDSIHLYYLHRVDPQTPLEESLTAIKDYRDRGKIRNVGVSNVTVDEVERARRVVPIAAVQNHYNVSHRRDDGLVDYCGQEGIAFVPYFPLQVDIRPGLREVAARHRASPQQVMLAWLLHRSAVMLPIPGTLSQDHLEHNLGALQLDLTAAELRTLGT